MILDRLGVPAGDDEQVADAGRDEAGDDVFEDGFALNAKHGFGQGMGELPHARAFARRQNDRFHFRHR